MRARVVIGANFGDEGKGLVTDWLCATQGADVVVRFNGGAQAGHTVVTPEGQRHVFGHFGAGSFLGVPTFLSQFFICNPIMFFKELDMLHGAGLLTPLMFAHPECLVTTFADMIINQRKEDARGRKRHGSVGLGVHETMVRSRIPQLTITMADLWNHVPLEERLREICSKFSTYRTGRDIDSMEKMDEMITSFVYGCAKFAEIVAPLGIAQCKDPVFEGAQGLLLDQNNKDQQPHVTHSSTGMDNVRVLCAQAGVDDIDAYYVSRTYLTRHGAGPMDREDPDMEYEDMTNGSHEYQGALRFAPLHYAAMLARCRADFGDGFKLVLTHCDQLLPSPGYAYEFFATGPTRDDVGVVDMTEAGALR